MHLDDRDMVTDALLMEKHFTTSYVIAENEAANLHLRKVLHEYLLEDEDLHTKLFNIMHQRGWYKTPAAGRQAIESAISNWEQKMSRQDEMRV